MTNRTNTAPQKNFRTGADFRAAFEAFCQQNGYDERAVFFAGIRAFDEANAAKRLELFSGNPDWQQRFVQRHAKPRTRRAKAPAMSKA